MDQSQAESWQKIKELLDTALDLPAAERADFLDRECPNAECRTEVEEYLAVEDEVDGFIEEPIAHLLPEQPPEGREGQQVGAYRLQRSIGHGGMGRVYLASRADDAYQHEVAVKILKRGLDTDEIVARFQRERQILANLDHPHIARIVDGGSTEDGLPYFVMEHVEGTPIHRYCRDRDLSVNERLRIFRRICETVHVAHQNLIVHCDLKPGNILVDEAGSPKLLDFGIAKMLRPDGSDTTLTRLGGRLGTPRYASPEQEAGGAITTASDVYSLGVVLYELLAGEPPVRPSEGPMPATTPSSAVSPQVTQAFPERPALIKPSSAVRRALGRGEGLKESERRHLERLHGKLKGDLDKIVLKATHPEPGRRYGSAADLAEDIHRHLDNLPVRARPDTFLYRTGRFVRRHPVGVGASTVALLVILSLLVMLTVQLKRAKTHLSSFLELLSTFDATDRSGKRSADLAYETLGALSHELSSSPADRALMQNRIGRVYLHYDFLEEAQEKLEESLRIRQRLPSFDREAMIEGLNDLAAVLNQRGGYEEALSYLDKAPCDEMPEEPEARDACIAVLNSRATALVGMRDFSSAEDIQRRLLDLKLEIYGARNDEIALTLGNLAEVLLRLDRVEEAKFHLQQGLALRRELLGPRHLRNTFLLNNLAYAHDALGEHQEAIRSSREIFEIRSEHFPYEHTKTAAALTMQGFVLLGRGDPADLERAEKLLGDALSIFRDKRGPDSETALNAQRHLAVVYLGRGDAAGAETLIREVIELREQKQEDWRLADAQSVLGAALMAQDRLAEAEPLLRESYPVISEIRGEGSRYAREARERIEALEELLDARLAIRREPSLRSSG